MRISFGLSCILFLISCGGGGSSGTDPLLADTDGDGIPDTEDANQTTVDFLISLTQIVMTSER